MKKLFTILLCSTMVGLTLAQEDLESSSYISKGTYELSGGISINFADNVDKVREAESDSFGFSLLPKLGYAINDDLVLGIQLGFGYNENNSTGEFDNNYISRQYSFVPYIKKYFLISNNFTFDLQGEIGYSLTNTNRTFETSGWSIGIRPGLNYRLNQSLGFSTQIGFLGYRNSKSESDFDNTESQNFNFNLNSSDFRVGLTYFF